MSDAPRAAGATTVGDWLRGCALARVDALALLRELAGVGHAAVIARPERELDAALRQRLDAAAARLHDGEPLAYVVGWREFHGLRFRVSPDVLVPRPETELLVDFALAHARPGAALLDLGTGSGAVAVTLAHELADAEVWAVDASAAALDIARANASALLPGGRELRLAHGDWYAALPADAPRFDLIVSNPPYVAAGDPHLHALRFEPRLALVGARTDSDGLADLRRIVHGAPRHLRAGGWLALEHGHDQARAVRAMLVAAGLREVHSLKDLAGIERVGVGRAPADIPLRDAAENGISPAD
ncbi:release factor glutamine methyltransferase [mine drainage metagenome]|uniref:peptide chain release factor N(5)-glutamine methyltransferase n=1 Tax=mine drainage metagenome TaxID=410659 RepID=A0A1J5QI37_9ZZZZ